MNPYNQVYYGRPSYGYQFQPMPMQQVPQQIPQVPQMQQTVPQSMPQTIQTPIQNIILQGKSVDSIDVVKAMDIPLDGSISYFPLTDGTAIVTKQLQMDGTSKTIIYKPVVENEKEEKTTAINYITPEVLDEKVKVIHEANSNVQDGIVSIKEQIEHLSGNLKELTNEMRNYKGGKR